MNVGGGSWDAHHAFLDGEEVSLPASGWIVQPPAESRVFGLAGGTSTWKSNAPTVRVVFPQDIPTAGWVTSSSNPNDDNVSLWASSDSVVRSYRYTFFVHKGIV